MCRDSAGVAGWGKWVAQSQASDLKPFVFPAAIASWTAGATGTVNVALSARLSLAHRGSNRWFRRAGSGFHQILILTAFLSFPSAHPQRHPQFISSSSKY